MLLVDIQYHFKVFQSPGDFFVFGTGYHFFPLTMSIEGPMQSLKMTFI